jgi:putative Holliday junction resolvase
MPSESGARGRPGRVLGLDHGSRRVGVAVSDALRMTAQPLEVVSRTGAVARVAEIVAEYEIEEIVVG